MGINLGTAILISKTGVFDKFRNDDLGCDVMTLGHQVMSLTSDRQKKLVSRSFECNSNVNVRKSSLLLNSYSDDFLKDIGARSIDSLDFSDFEKSTYVRNLNVSFESDPSCEDLRSKYDLVLDFGTSEHIFNPVLSIANSIFMLREGGGLVLVLPVSGWLEHGFFQFSPNFFRSLEGDGLLLHRLYIFSRHSDPLQIWDGKKFINITLYESLPEKFSAFAVLEKTSSFNQINFLTQTNQGCYVRKWDNKVSEKKSKNTIINSIKSIVKYFVEDSVLYKKIILNKYRVRMEEIGKIG